MERKRYTVTVHAAALGTPLRGDAVSGEGETSEMERSVPGHVFYTTSDGTKVQSWGFGPVNHGDINGPGHSIDNDLEQYVSPYYERTMEISKGQFDTLNNFGEDPEKYGFDLAYKDVRNNCVDYTWAALNQAGIQRTQQDVWGQNPEAVHGKRNLLPAHADKDIRAIRDPIPGSDLNKEVTRDRPDMKWWQIPLSDVERQQPMLHDDAFERLYSATAANDDKAFATVGQDYLQSNEGQAFLQSGQEFNRQQALAEQQAQTQAQAQQGPVMRMTM